MSSHTVKSGETLGSIAVRHYGSWSAWTRIRDANAFLSGRKKSSDGSPLIYPGDILIIQKDNPPASEVRPEAAKVVALDGAKPDDFSVFVDGKVFTGFTNFRLQLNDDSFDAFSMSAPYDEEDMDLAALCAPFSYKDCDVYFAKKLVFSGKLLSSEVKISTNGNTIDFQGYPKCGILGDCPIPDSKYPPQYKGLTLAEIASQAADCFGVSAKVDGDAGAVFDDVSYEVGETIVSFLRKLSEQRGFVITNDEQGNLLFWNAKPCAPCLSIEEGDLRFLSCAPSWNAQDFFSSVTGYGKVGKEKDSAPEKYTWQNKYLLKRGVNRPFSFVVQDEEKAGGIEKATVTKAASMVCSCVSYQLKIFGVTDKDGNVFKKGCCVEVYAPHAQIRTKTKFQCAEIEMTRDDTNGTVTTMKLVLPGLRKNEIPEVFPWED